MKQGAIRKKIERPRRLLLSAEKWSAKKVYAPPPALKTQG